MRVDVKCQVEVYDKNDYVLDNFEVDDIKGTADLNSGHDYYDERGSHGYWEELIDLKYDEKLVKEIIEQEIMDRYGKTYEYDFSCEIDEGE